MANVTTHDQGTERRDSRMVWGVIIAIAVSVIWALTAHGWDVVDFE